jgi:hypothetical protein
MPRTYVDRKLDAIGVFGTDDGFGQGLSHVA